MSNDKRLWDNKAEVDSMAEIRTIEHQCKHCQAVNQSHKPAGTDMMDKFDVQAIYETTCGKCGATYTYLIRPS